MAKVITELEIKEYSGMNQAVFPADTIITPSARDWAKEHRLQIVVAEGKGEIRQNLADISGIDRESLLRQVIMIVIAQLEKSGAPVRKTDIVETVLVCLERLGCQIADF